ncbi:MAG: hypothetical protein ACXU8Q_06765 [Caulobacteraceae bacterium]
MDPEIGIETRTNTNRPPRASRAPWDPPPRPAKPGALHQRAAPEDAPPDEPAVLGGYYEELGRGAD